MKTKIHHWIHRAFFLIFLCFFGFIKKDNRFPHSQNQETNLIHAQIQQILKRNSSLLKNVGIAVSEITPDPNRFSFFHNENKLFIPASLSKIITSSALLHYFEPFHQFETSFVSAQPVNQGKLKGNLYLKGGGDPAFVSESLWMLVNHLTRSGLKVVEGNFIVDPFLFEKHSRKKRGFFSLDRSYNALLSALSFNWNSVNIYIRPALQANHLARVFIDPENTYIQLKNKVQTKGNKKNIHVNRIPSSLGDTIRVRGTIPLKSAEYVVYKNITQPALWTGYNAIEFLKRRGIQVQGHVLKGQSPSQFYILSTYKGRKVFRLIQDMMKFSSNFIADMLVIQLSLLKGSSRGKLDEGMKWILHYMEKNGIKDYVFVQPSGLSRKNKLKPGDILNLLIKDAHSKYAFEKIAAYPLAGGEGTLKNRFQNLNHSSVVRAKTGWLSGVVGLAGYVLNPSGTRRAFVLIYNGSARKQFKAQKLFDELVSVLAEY